MSISVLLVDDHPMFRKGLRLLIEEESDMRVVGEAGDGLQAIEQARELAPNVVVMDITMPNLNGIEATQGIVENSPGTKVVALSIHTGKQFVEDMLAAGAKGYVVKDSVPEDITNCIRWVMNDQVYLSSEITDVVISGFLARREAAHKSETPDDGSIDYSDISLFTKIQKPPLNKNYIRRQSLFERFAEAIQHPLTLVVAPAGYGKTMAVSGWLETLGSPSAWVSLDKNDNDIRQFTSCLISAIQEDAPDACRETQRLIKEMAVPSVPVLAASLVKSLERLDSPYVIVLDDFHMINDPSILDLISQVLRHPPSALHLMLIGRRDPSLPISKLRAMNRLKEVRTQHLRFSKTETATYLTRKLGKTVDPDVAAVVEEKTEGWITGLHLAALSMRHRGKLNPQLLGSQVNAQYVMEYLFEEVFSTQRPEIINYLLGACILDRFTGPLCEAVCPPLDGSSTSNITGWQFIDWLKQENLFIIPVDAENRWFRFHQLFKNLVANQLVRRLSPEAIRSLHNAASAWFAESGMITEAIHHAQKAGDAGGAAKLVVRHGFGLLNHAKWTRLDGWVNMLPVETIERDPGLMVLTSWLHMVYARYPEMGACLDKAETLADIRSTAEPIQGHLDFLRSVQRYLARDAENSLILAKQAIEIIPLDHQWARNHGYIVCALAHQMLGERANTKGVIEEALQASELSDEAMQAAFLASTCCLYWIDADLESMLRTAAQSVKMQKNDTPTQAMAIGFYHMGVAHYHRNELPAAEKSLLKVVQHPDSQYALNYVHSAFALALTYQAGFQDDPANQLGEQVVSYALEINNPGMLQIAQAFKAELAFRQGRTAEAFRWADQYDAQVFVPMHAFFIPQLTHAKLFMLQGAKGYRRQAGELIDRIHELLISIHNVRFQIDTLALKALFLDMQGDESAAVNALTQSLAIAEPGGFVRPFVDLGSPMADLLKKCIKQNIAVSYIGHILGAFRNENKKAIRNGAMRPAAQTALVGSQPLVEQLTVREQEILNLLVGRLSNKEIAAKLFIAPTTVKKHLNNIYGKLGVSNRRQAVEKSEALGILSSR